MVKDGRIVIGCVVVMVFCILFGVSNKYTPEPVEAKSENPYSMNYIGPVDGASAQLWQDSNGCYWIKDSGGYKQVFKSTSNMYSDTQPYCGKIE